MILQKFMAHIDRQHFFLEAVLQTATQQENQGIHASAHAQNNSLPRKESSISRIKQEWRLGEGPYYELANGRKWTDCQVDLEFILPLKEAVVGSGCIARGLSENEDWVCVKNISLRIHTHFIDVLLSLGDGADVFLRYSWDEYSQLKAPKVIAGKLESIPVTLRESLKKGCFGRFGLLSRCMRKAVKQLSPMDDMGSLRWA